MKLTTLTAFCLRLFSLWLFWKALDFIVDTIQAYNFYDSLRPGTTISDPAMINFMGLHGDISLQLCQSLALYALFYFAAGAALMFFSLPLARLLNKGLE